MLYWPKKEEDLSLVTELLNGKQIMEIHIATAFLSDDGISILEQMKNHYHLPKEKINLILSSEFSVQLPAEKLKKLCSFCQVRVLHAGTLHAKAYWLKGSPSKLIMGSSNLTRGGFERNIELDSISELDAAAEKDVASFFAYCRTRSLAVDDAMIAYYESITPQLKKLDDTQRGLHTQFRGYQRSSDPFDEHTYDFTNSFFKYEDYEVLFPRNQANSNNPDIQAQRKKLQQKLLQIHAQVYPEINKLGLFCHRSKDHITSLTFPCKYNHGKVGWMGVRYGKSPKEIDQLNLGTESKEEEYGFQKHGCIQFCVGADGFEINLFHAVRHDAIDRAYLHENLKKQATSIIKEIEKLNGQGMVWRIAGINDDAKLVDFDFDSNDAKDFISYYKKYDEDGLESFLYLSYKPDDPRIQTLQSIKELVIEKTKLLFPLYQTMVFRIP